MLEKLLNYFFGKDIIQYYQSLKQKYPEERKKLNRERNLYIFSGKIVPNTMDISGLALSITFSNLIYAALIGGGEAVRQDVNKKFLSKQFEYVCRAHIEATEMIMSKLENPKEIRD